MVNPKAFRRAVEEARSFPENDNICDLASTLERYMRLFPHENSYTHFLYFCRHYQRDVVLMVRKYVGFCTLYVTGKDKEIYSDRLEMSRGFEANKNIGRISKREFCDFAEERLLDFGDDFCDMVDFLYDYPDYLSFVADFPAFSYGFVFGDCDV